jgi:hypothetical protein
MATLWHHDTISKNTARAMVFAHENLYEIPRQMKTNSYLHQTKKATSSYLSMEEHCIR